MQSDKEGTMKDEAKLQNERIDVTSSRVQLVTRRQIGCQLDSTHQSEDRDKRFTKETVSRIDAALNSSDGESGERGARV